MLQPPVTAEEVARDLAEILEGSPEESAPHERAYRVVSNILENVYQVFAEAISELPKEDWIRLFTMAALGASTHSFSADWILGELLDHADARALPAFRRWATEIDTEKFLSYDARACYVLAMRGCSLYLDQPPTPRKMATDTDRAWCAYGAIIFWLYRPALSVLERRAAAAQWWELLHSKWPIQAVGPLVRLERLGIREGPLDELCSVFPDDVRQVLEFGLVNRASLTETFTWTAFDQPAAAALIRWFGVAAGGARRAVALHRCAGARRLRRFLPRDHRERPARREAPLVGGGLAHRPPCPLSRRRSMPSTIVPSGARSTCGSGHRANRPSRRSSWWPSSSFTPSTPCSSIVDPTTSHAYSSLRRRLGLDTSWDVWYWSLAWRQGVGMCLRPGGHHP
jgi:hypothetical protein